MTISACPICERPATSEFKPFCSPRCKDEDLCRWLAAEYRIPTRPELDPEDEGDGIEEPRG